MDVEAVGVAARHGQVAELSPELGERSVRQVE